MTQIQRGAWLQEKIELLKSEFVTDDVVDGWFLMGSFQPVFWIAVAYLLFVLKLGPKIMEKREPLPIRGLMVAYNLFQIFFNAWLVWLLFSTPGSLLYVRKDICHFHGRKQDNPYFLPVLTGSWYFFISKLIDLLDTVFFVLRKKQSHITFFHVFHHVNVLILSWTFLKYMKDEHAVLPGLLNSFVHIWMSSYYLLAALGPPMRKYLWWKKHMTQLQIGHLVIILAYIGVLMSYRCKVLISLTLYIAANIFVFLYFFLELYFRRYIKGTEATIGEEMNKKIR